MSSSLRKPISVGFLAGGLTALAVFGGTGAFLAAAQDSPDTTAEAPDAPMSPDTTVSPDATEPPEGAPPVEERQAEMEEWRQCLADNGVELPEPQLDENGRPVKPSERPQLDESQREAFESAVDACGRPPMHRHGGPGGRGFGGPGRGCEEEGTVPDGTTPETTPEAEGSSYSV
jgi:hypothetical protein